MKQGALVPDAIDRRHLPRAPRAARRRRAARPRRLPAHARPGRGARRGARRAGRAGRPRRSTSRSRAASSSRRLAGRGSAGPPATSTTSGPSPPRRDRASATSTARELYQRADDEPETVRARLATAAAADVRGRRPLPRPRGPARRSTAGSPIDEVDRARDASCRWATPGDQVTRKSPREIGQMRRRRAGSWPRSWRCSSRSCGRASRPSSSTASRRSTSGRRRDPVVHGLPRRRRYGRAARLPGQHLHLDRRRGRPRHPGRARHPRGPDRLGRRRRDRRWLARRRGPDVRRRRGLAGGARARRGHPAGDDGRHRRGPAGQPHRRHLGAPSRTSPRPHGYGVVRQFVGHGIGTEMHEEPQVPNYRTGHRGRSSMPGPLPGHRADVHARRRIDVRVSPTAGRS